MAVNATIYKFDLDVSDLDRHHYAHYSHHVALHPSETIERMVMRVIAFALNAHEQLVFTKGLSTDHEPDLWQKNYSDEIELWIELGLPDEKRIKKAHNQSRVVKLYAYGGQSVDTWWQNLSRYIFKYERVSVYRFDSASVEAFAQSVARTMSLNVLIQDGQFSLSWDDGVQSFDIDVLHEVTTDV